MADRAIREKETMHKTGYTRSSMWKAIREGRFPRPVKLPGTRAVAWSENAVNAWVDAQFKNVPVENVPAPTGGWQPGPAAMVTTGIESTRWPAGKGGWKTGPLAFAGEAAVRVMESNPNGAGVAK